MRFTLSYRRLIATSLLGAMMLAAAPAVAVEPDEVLADARLEARARALSADLRCLVCQNQSIDDSNAPLARDLRLVVRERLEAGDTDAEIKKFVVARYGEFVLLEPPFAWHTVLLWLTPLLVLAIAAAALWRGARRRATAESSIALSPEEEERLRQLLRDP